jgi:hypothetical protein
MRGSPANGGDELGRWIRRGLRAGVDGCHPSDQVWHRIACHVRKRTCPSLTAGFRGRTNVLGQIRPAVTALCIGELSCFLLWWKADFML